ncbi:MAG: hypothetical protein JXR80_03875 [Deltaproteobacteria bacterium]|nr:hypothetical protein [Deltaproteobacteria bacterium]
MAKKITGVVLFLLMMVMSLSVLAADIKVKGDFNNRFTIYTNHNDWLVAEKGVLGDGDSPESWGETRYRLWVDAATNDGKVKGVWAAEVGGLAYGTPGSTGASVGGSYSGDGVNTETRWLYTDFQLPWLTEKARVRMGLQPFTVNSWLWSETIMGVTADFAAGPAELKFAWLRPYRDEVKDHDSKVEDLDAFYGRVNFKPARDIGCGLFAVYFNGDSGKRDPALFSTITSQNYELKKLANNYVLDLLTVGSDGKADFGMLFCNWDLMYQVGSIDNANFRESYNGWDFNERADNRDFAVNAWLAHVDIGCRVDKMKFTYTFWYASGDDDGSDSDFDAFMAVDIDRADNICIFKAMYADDNFFTEKDYLLDKGFIMNKLAFDYKFSKKLSCGSAAMYMLTAEDIVYLDDAGKPRKENEVGFELDAYLKYKLYENLEFAINAGYLFSGDAMDFWEVGQRDGSSDEDIFISSCKVQYKL